MHIATIALSVLIMAFGVFIFVFGGYDDSPGAQLLGLLIVISGIVWIVRSRNKH